MLSAFARAAAVRAPLAPLARRSMPLARSAVTSTCSSLLPRSAVAAPLSVRGFAVTNVFDRSANTSEFLDFETSRKDLNKWRKQLLYRSRQRGWLELDLIMGTWADENLSTLDAPSLEQYAAVVASENPDLIKAFVERMPLPDNLQTNNIALQLVDYAQNQKKRWTCTVESGNQ